MDAFGITGLGSYLPPHTQDAWEAAQQQGMERSRFERLGFGRLPLAAEDEMPTDMAAQASRRALEDANLGPDDIDVIIYTGVLKEYSRWQASNKVQATLGAFNSYVFDMDQNAAGEVLALRLACDLIKHEPEVARVLVCSAERWGTSLEGRLLGKSLLLGDGASAAVVERGTRGLRLRGLASATDGACHGRVCMPRLGAAVKMDRELLQSKGHLLQVVREVEDGPAGRRARDELHRLAREAFEQALQQAGVRSQQVELVVLSALPRPHAEELLGAIGCPPERSSIDYVDQTGVMGGPEIFHGLLRAREQRRFSTGHLLALVAAGAGLSVSAAIVEA